MTKSRLFRVRRRQRPSRGVILLIVLSLLALFVVLVVTFVVVSSQYRNMSVAGAKYKVKGDDWKRLSQQAVHTLIRDTNDPNASIRYMSLLRDMYGDDHVLGLVGPTVAVRVNGQMVDFEAAFPLLPNYPKLAGFYAGRVLTFTTGNARNVSVRVVGYNPTGTIPVLRILATPDLILPSTGDAFVINGRPFSGEGFGLYSNSAGTSASEVATFNLDSVHPGPDGKWGVATVDDDANGATDDFSERLFPGSDDGIYSLWPGSVVGLPPSNTTHLPNYLAGGGDEDYDAPDQQNMHLGAVIYDANHTTDVSGSPDQEFPANRLSRPVFVEPSFHRTALIDFWFKWINENILKQPPLNIPDAASPQHPDALRLGVFLQPYGKDNRKGTADDPFAANNASAWNAIEAVIGMKQKFILRPLPERNPQFTGGNDQLLQAMNGLSRQHRNNAAAVYLYNPYTRGPWDADSDGDGFPDSVWLDIGLPLQTDRDGRTLKPLVAMLCLDMDGRINLNAAGFVLPNDGPPNSTPPANLARALAFNNLPRGMGYGPSEIYISRLLAGQDAALLAGLGTTPGRYGFDQRPGRTGLELVAPQKFREFPGNYFNTLVYQTAYQTPPDLWGELRLGLDHRGQPNYSLLNTGRDLLTDNPFDSNLTAINASGTSESTPDTLFGATDLESLALANDLTANSSLLIGPSRLSRLVTTFSTDKGAPANRTLVSTHSFDLPIPNFPRISDFSDAQAYQPNDNLRRPLHIGDVIRRRVQDRFRYGGFTQNRTGMTEPVYFPGFGANWNSNNWTIQGVSRDVKLSQQVFIPANPPTVPTSYTVPAELIRLAAPELLLGERMNLNRPFGNGSDNNNNKVVDEHWQGQPWATNESYVYIDNVTPANTVVENINGYKTDPDNDGLPVGLPGIPTDVDAFQARQILARHLYVLAMAYKPRQFHFNGATYASSGATREANDENDARVLAQWAINVVDFYDPDSIMTPFEYDVDPFEPHPGVNKKWGKDGFDDDNNGTTDDVTEALAPGSDDILWSVDGWLGTWTDDQGTSHPSDDDPVVNPRRRLVWGCERPELLISETIAWHETRTEDLMTSYQPVPMSPAKVISGRTTDMGGEQDGGTSKIPNNRDQRLRPLGAFFVELYNPWSAPAERAPAEFYYDPANGTFKSGLWLDKRTSGTTGDPIWRLLVTDPTSDTPLDVEDDEDDDNDNPDTVVTAEMPVPTDVIYFTTSGPAVGTAKLQTNSVAIAPVPGGRHAVVGTYRSNFTDLADPNTGVKDNNASNEYVCTIGRRNDGVKTIDQTRRIVMHVDPQDPEENWVSVEGNGSTTVPNRVLTPANIPNVSATNYVATVKPAVAVPINGLNISEGTYPTQDLMGTNISLTTAENSEGVYSNPFDLPFDNLESPYLRHKHVAQDGHHKNFRAVHLQRLANPLVPYDPVLNPYRTIDSMSVDLNVFNGLDSLPAADYDQTLPAPVPPTDGRMGGGIVKFDSRERGDTSNHLWPHLSVDDAPDTTAGAVASHWIDEDFVHSFGFTNSNLATRNEGNPTAHQLFQSVQKGMGVTTAPSLEYVGDPDTRTVKTSKSEPDKKPYPWLTWNNRPFISQNEIMMVPRSSSFDLFRDFSIDNTNIPYDSLGAPTGMPAIKPLNTGTFGHLLNFFASTHREEDPANTGTTPKSYVTEYGPDLYKLLELLHVPSRYVGTETWLNPKDYVSNNQGTELLHPPFNRISNFRDPGKVNLNTIMNIGVAGTDDSGGDQIDDMWNLTIWEALLGSGTLGPIPSAIVNSRRGQSDVRRAYVQPSLPSFFNNVFRGSDGGSLVEFTETLGKARYTSTNAFWKEMQERPGVEATLLRSNRIDGTLSDPSVQPPTLDPLMLDGSLTASTATTDARDPTRNPYFRYRQLLRMPNLTTTRSNVYAVWMTLGYFELDPSGNLGREVGSETGDVRRYRSFFVIDRSIPVAFEPGQDHNVDRTILLHRFLK